MITCAGCSRFVRSEALRCPFCDATQRDEPSPVRPAMAGMLLGLTLTACGGGSTGDDGAGSSTTSAPGTMSDTTASTTMVGVDTDGEEVGTAYGGPGFDTSPPEEESAGSTSTTIGDSTGTGTGTETGTGTGGTSTGGTSTSGQ